MVVMGAGVTGAGTGDTSTLDKMITNFSILGVSSIAVCNAIFLFAGRCLGIRLCDGRFERNGR